MGVCLFSRLSTELNTGNQGNLGKHAKYQAFSMGSAFPAVGKSRESRGKRKAPPTRAYSPQSHVSRRLNHPAPIALFGPPTITRPPPRHLGYSAEKGGTTPAGPPDVFSSPPPRWRGHPISIAPVTASAASHSGSVARIWTVKLPLPAKSLPPPRPQRSEPRFQPLQNSHMR